VGANYTIKFIFYVGGVKMNIKDYINAEMVIEAYKLTGIKPVFGTFHSDVCNGGCMLTVLAAAKLNIDDAKNAFIEGVGTEDQNFETFRSLMEWPEDIDVANLYDGFDDNLFGTDSEEYKVGFEIRNEVIKQIKDGVLDGKEPRK
jgi:hypothetical protein